MLAYSANEIIEMACQIEKNGYAFYNAALKKNQLSAKGKEIITLLRDQEINHEQYFLSLRDDIDQFMLSETTDWELIAMYLKSITDSRLFNNPEGAINLATSATNELAIINFAIVFEKETLLYFYAIRDNITVEKTKEVLARIIQEEVTHVMRLTEYKKTIS